MSMRAPAAPARRGAPLTATPRPAPATAPVKQDPEKQHRRLRVVRPGELSPRARRRRARLAAVFTVGLIALGLFATVVFHVVITQNQFRLDHLRDQASAEQTRYQRLRLQVAELESPERIVATAQDRLGMVQPPKVAYLAPQQPAPGAQPAKQQHDTPSTGAGAQGASTNWSAVKSQLAQHP